MRLLFCLLTSTGQDCIRRSSILCWPISQRIFHIWIYTSEFLNNYRIWSLQTDRLESSNFSKKVAPNLHWTLENVHFWFQNLYLVLNILESTFKKGHCTVDEKYEWLRNDKCDLLWIVSSHMYLLFLSPNVNIILWKITLYCELNFWKFCQVIVKASSCIEKNIMSQS